MANNEDIVKTLAKMVDERLTVEFEKRDKAILDLKKGMDTLVQSLRENGNNNMKRLKSGSQSARGSPRPALAGRRLSPRPILLICVIPNGIRGPVHWVFL